MKICILILSVFITATSFIHPLPVKNNIPVLTTNDTTPKPQQNRYKDMRDLALSMTPERLNLKITATETKVFGVIMDWHMGDAIATIACYSTGDASLYLSTGNILLGGGQHETVNKAAQELVKKAQAYLPKAMKTASTVLPVKDNIRFFLLTNLGKYTVQESFKNFENNSSAWLPLFNAGNDVITALRVVQEQKK